MQLSELLHVCEPGQSEGTCYVCGSQTNKGHAEAPSGTFTAWSSCVGGAVCCGGCWALLKDKRTRFYSWLALPGELRIANADDRGLLWQTLLNPPQEQWACYQTVGGQKQGWLSIADRVNESRETYLVAADWTDRPILMRLPWAAEHGEVIAALRTASVTKASLKSGQWSMRDYRRALDADLLDAQRIANAVAGDPRWEVLVNAHHIDVE